MQKKRILIFSTAYFPFVGGAEVAVREITKRLEDYEFVMITARLRSDLPDVEKIGNIGVHRMGKGDHWDKYRLIAQGARYASKLGHFDAIWGIMASYAGFAALRFKKQNPKTPFLLTLQEGDSRWQIYKHVWWCWPYFKQIFKRADKIQAISNYLAEWARGLGAKCEVEVVANGVDLEEFGDNIGDKRYEIRDNIKQSLDIKKDDRIVITVSRLVKKNGVGDLIRAMKYLDCNAHLLIAGDGELKNKLVKLASRLGLASRVHFFGCLNHEELLPYLWSSDVFCRPSLSEGLGNVFLEAMAAGVPIIGTRVGGIPDFLVDPSNSSGQVPTGLFCKVGDPKNISENIKKILSAQGRSASGGEDINLREKLIANGRKLVEEKYSWDLIANKMRNVFETL